MDQTVASKGQGSGFVAPPVTETEKNAIIAGVLIAMLLAALDQTIVSPALPTIGGALGHAEYLPWIVTGYLLTATAMAPLYGKISDIYGRRPTIFAAIAIFLAGSVVSALAPNMATLVGGRALQGLGGGGLIALAQTVIGDLVSPRERARYTSWISGTWAVASIAGPLLGGFFAEHLHWSLIFWINLPVGAFAVYMLSEPLKKLKVVPRDHRIDAVGALLLIAATGLLLLGLNWGGAVYSWGSWQIMAIGAGSLALWLMFAFRLTQAREPLISLEVLRDQVVLTATLSMFLSQASFVGLSVFFPIYLQHVVGLSVSESGIALLGLLLGTVAGAGTCGRLLPLLVHYKRIAIAGATLSIVCLVILATVAETASLALIEVLTIGAGIGSGTMFPVATVSVQNAVDRAHLGVATGVLSFLRSLGGALGVAVLGAIALGHGMPMVSEAMRTAATMTADAGAFMTIFYTAAAGLVLSLVLLLLMEERVLQGSSEPPPVAIAD